MIWLSSQKLEKYSVLSASKYGISPFLIGSTIIAFGTSAPEMLTSLFAVLEGKSIMVVGNVIGSNIANIALVFGLTLAVLFFKKEYFVAQNDIKTNLILLILSTIVIWAVMYVELFHFYSSIFLLFSLLVVLIIWYKTNTGFETDTQESKENFLILKLISSLGFLVLSAWLITKGALNILDSFGVGEMFVGFTVLAFGTSLPEIAASLALALKGRYETVAGTLIGSNIFNGLFVLAIPGLFSPSYKFVYTEWIPILVVLLFVTMIFCIYIFSRIKKPKKASLMISFLLFTSYLLSLYLVY